MTIKVEKCNHALTCCYSFDEREERTFHEESNKNWLSYAEWSRGRTVSLIFGIKNKRCVCMRDYIYIYIHI